MTKKVILTGLRANNDLHIGNYFGAILPVVDIANTRSKEFQVNLFVPDLHSFTTPINHTLLQGQILNTVRLFVAAGLPIENPDVYIYRQSYIPAHSELTIILNCFTGMGQLERMTQYKDKSSKHKDTITAGLFDYPVLMAADILLYNATYVPVGDDQTQHLEFTRDIAMRMNAKFGEVFTVPVEVKKQHELFKKDQGLRIMDLQDPTKKMSKSDDSGRGVIFLTDSAEEVRKKIMSATTDSFGKINYDPIKQPGLSNLIEILALLENSSEQAVLERYKDQSMYGPLKEELASKMVYFLNDFQTKLASVDEDKLLNKIVESENSIRDIANATLLRAQKAVGLR